MAYIRFNEFEFDEENTRCWVDLTQQGERLICVNGFIRTYYTGGGPGTAFTGGMQTLLDNIIDATREENGRFYFGERDRFLNVIRKEPLVYTRSYEPWPPYETAWAVRFQAEDPFFYADVETQMAVTYTGKFDVNVGGNTEAWASIRVGFTGIPAGGIEIRNNTTGKSLNYIREIGNGDVLEISMKEREIKKNGIVDILETEDEGYFSLIPGINEMELQCVPAVCDLLISFQDRWR